MSRHLVTGGTGFLGAALVRALLAEGRAVRVLDDGSRGHPRRLADVRADVELLDGDVRDAAAMAKACAGCEVVWHLAWINGTRFFYERPDDVLDVGLRGTLCALDAALAAGVRRFVFASSSEVYNTPDRVPTPEDERALIPDVQNPRFSYGGGKLAGELLTLHLGGRRGLETVIFRPHNFYGPDMGFAHVIPEVVERIVRLSDGLRRKKLTLPIQGDGRETRAFCHVTDGARGALLAGERGASGEVYHVGREDEVAIGALIERIGAVLGVELTLVPGERPAGGTPRRCPAIGKLRGLGYAPAIDLDAGLAETVLWYRDECLKG